MGLHVPKIKIPPGYTDIVEWCEQNPDEEIVLENIRWVNKQFRYIIDPDNPDLLRFLEQCKSDTKALERALRDELRARELPVWVLRRPRRSYAKKYRKMSFLIRPPFFPSEKEVEKNENNRMQTADDRDDFVLHFDENHVLQEVRYWFPCEMAIDYNSRMVRGAICASLKQQRQFLQENYGNWEVIAGMICDILVLMVG